jgi:hypothetical protein
MIDPNLTLPRGGATSGSVNGARGQMMKALAVLIGLSALCGGCINITAPDKPIVIQLDINVRAEVLYALAEDAANTIEQNGDIF